MSQIPSNLQLRFSAVCILSPLIFPSVPSILFLLCRLDENYFLCLWVSFTRKRRQKEYKFYNYFCELPCQCGFCVFIPIEFFSEAVNRGHLMTTLMSESEPPVPSVGTFREQVNSSVNFRHWLYHKATHILIYSLPSLGSGENFWSCEKSSRYMCGIYVCVCVSEFEEKSCAMNTSKENGSWV